MMVKETVIESLILARCLLNYVRCEISEKLRSFQIHCQEKGGKE